MTPIDLTEQSLEQLLTELAQLPYPYPYPYPYKLTLDFNAVTRFEIVGPYCPIPRDQLYVHEVYPTDLDPDHPRYLTVLLAL